MRWVTLALVLVIVAGCSINRETVPSQPDNGSKVSGTPDLILTDNDLQQLGMTAELDEEVLQQLGIEDGTNCRTETGYSNIVDSTTDLHSLCVYDLEKTQVITILQKYENFEALNGSYQYDSSHYFSQEGLISENTFGDMSRFRVSSPNDYGGEFNDPEEYVYHLWIAKDLYLIHVTSKGKTEVEDDIAAIANLVLNKFG